MFPEGTPGIQLDVLARKALWKDGLNYMVSSYVLLVWRGGGTDWRFSYSMELVMDSARS